MKKKIRLAIVDDNSIYKSTLTAFFNGFKDFKISIKCSNGQELKENLMSQIVDVVLLDFKMPVMDGLKTTEFLSEYYPNIKIIILTAYDNTIDSLELIEKGAHGFLPKDNGLNQIVDAIYTVLKQQEYYVGKGLKKTISPKAGKNDFTNELKLTDREVQIIGLVCNGTTSKKIAEELCISKRTVDEHRRNVFQKTKTTSIAELTKFAVKHGLNG